MATTKDKAGKTTEKKRPRSVTDKTAPKEAVTSRKKADQFQQMDGAESSYFKKA